MFSNHIKSDSTNIAQIAGINNYFKALFIFHPNHQPSFPLDVLSCYPCEVHSWDNLPSAERSKNATLHTGVCKRCHTSLKAVEKDLSLKDIVTFGAKNMMDLLYGYPDPERLLMPDEQRLINERN